MEYKCILNSESHHQLNIIKDKRIVMNSGLSIKDASGPTLAWTTNHRAMLTTLDGEYVEQYSRYSMVSMSNNAHDTRWWACRAVLTILDGEHVEHRLSNYKYARCVYLETSCSIFYNYLLLDYLILGLLSYIRLWSSYLFSTHYSATNTLLGLWF